MPKQQETKHVNLIFPHQLFEDNPLLSMGGEVYLIEEHLFFNQYAFHKQKLAFHRASMKYYAGMLENKGIEVHYIEAQDKNSDVREFLKNIGTRFSSIGFIDPVDAWLEKRIRANAKGLVLKVLDNLGFLNTPEQLSNFFRTDKKSFFQTHFYKEQRHQLNILISDKGEPQGEKWTYDTENRKRYPKGKIPPGIQYPQNSEFWNEAIKYVQKHYGDNPGQISQIRIYPISHKESKDWLMQFLHFRFYDFGVYEDAIVKGQTILNHSLLSPLINAGLIMPSEVLDSCLKHAKEYAIPLNSTEGFVRQIIGWREFIRGMYICKGSYARTLNFWGFYRKIPPSFYNATTGILPVDETIKSVLKTGYCHHIERLMILGNFMLLCEFDPNEVYRWFMELFIDAYDWVMVPNVYGMSQFADGGTFATKPYIGGSNYIKKMSNYAKGDWEEVWDGLFWHFVHKHAHFFKKNPRTSMLHYSWQKMDEKKRKIHLRNAQEFLESLDF